VRRRTVAILAAAVLVGIGVWAAVHFRDSSSSTATTTEAATTTTATVARARAAKPPVAAFKPKAMTAAELKALAAKVAHPTYWAGPRSGVTYEVTKNAKGVVYVRYLPRGVKVGSTKPYLTIATYPDPRALAKMQSLIGRSDWTPIVTGGQAIAAYNTDHPTSVYIAYPGVDVQVEVYDPSAQRAHDLVASHAVVQLG
jgi:hypothetical protein